MPHSKRPFQILVVEDGDREREALVRMLNMEGFAVKAARSADEAIKFVADPIDLVISDLRMGKLSGLDLLANWRTQRPTTPFILLTAFGEVRSAVTAMKLGAKDFLAKPVDPLQLLAVVRSSLDEVASRKFADSLARNDDEIWEGIVGNSHAIRDVRDQTLRAAASSSTVLICGESGTGKELVADALHKNSPRRDGPFVVVNIAALPDTLVESELFGHIKGAFTNASADRVGRFRAAHGGSLFIDEIGDFPLHLQAKLLRALEQQTISPVGSNDALAVDVRVIAATSRPLTKMIQSGEFREDLFYRLNVISIQLPPLRERRSDIRILTNYFLRQFAARTRQPLLQPNAELVQTLETLDWPGNVRQLKNCLERMCVMAKGEQLTVADLPLDLKPPASAEEDAQSASRLESIKRSAILEALRQFNGNRTHAAAFLGISVRTLQRKIREWRIADEPH